MTYLTRDQIITVDDRTYEDVECPEWGGTVRIRSLSAGEFDRYQKSIINQKGNNRTVNLENVRTKLCVLCMVDDKGNQLFSEGDIGALSRKSSKPVDRIFEAAQRLTGMTDEDVEELAGDLDATPSDG